MPATACKECGTPIEAAKSRKEFCSKPCRMSWNNRRRDRGAELYDLFMAMRFERAEAKDERVWTLLCDRASAYRESDKVRRDGRKSWIDLKTVLTAIPIHRCQGVGDKR